MYSNHETHATRAEAKRQAAAKAQHYVSVRTLLLLALFNCALCFVLGGGL